MLEALPVGASAELAEDEALASTAVPVGKEPSEHRVRQPVATAAEPQLQDSVVGERLVLHDATEVPDDPATASEFSGDPAWPVQRGQQGAPKASRALLLHAELEQLGCAVPLEGPAPLEESAQVLPQLEALRA
jgi:hypothetical protein